MEFAYPPEYLPGPAFWSAALRADRVVLLTGAQYVRQSLHNRARIRTPQGQQWLTIPVRKGQLGRSIEETAIAWNEDWWRIHRKAFTYNYGSTPFFGHFAPELEALTVANTTSLAEVTVPLIRLLGRWLGFGGEIVELSAQTRPVPREILLGSSEDRGYAVRCDLSPYRQAFEGFVPGLSVIDLVMNYGPASREMILAGSEVQNRQSAEHI